MSRAIAHLLAQPEILIKNTIRKLEASNGYPNNDVRHIVENIQKVRHKISDMGLDPDDTTPRELYYALRLKYQRDCQVFDMENNFQQVDFRLTAAKSADIIVKNYNLPQCWVLKQPAAKTLLRQQPPKKLMKRLGYRSVDSMLKRRSVYQLIMAAQIIESATWVKAFHRLISQQDSTVLEIRHIRLSWLDAEIAPATSQAADLVYNDMLGVLALRENSTSKHLKLLGSVITIADFIVDQGATLLPHSSLNQSPVLKWWFETEGLMANLDNQAISLNLKDVCLSNSRQRTFMSRYHFAGRKAYWRNLLLRYENQIAYTENVLFDQAIDLKFNNGRFRQPAFEYADY